MKAEIISVGTEITSGYCLDTNGQWLSQRLGEIGTGQFVGRDVELGCQVDRVHVRTLAPTSPLPIPNRHRGRFAQLHL